MRSAPSVIYPVGRSRSCAVAMLLAWCAGGATLATWLALGPAPGWRHAFAAAVLLACALHALWTLRRMPVGELAWDGEAWCWRDALGACEVGVELVADLQRVMLLRLACEGGHPAVPGWLGVEQGADARTWQALRRAVHSRAGWHAPTGEAVARP